MKLEISINSETKGYELMCLSEFMGSLGSCRLNEEGPAKEVRGFDKKESVQSVVVPGKEAKEPIVEDDAPKNEEVQTAAAEEAPEEEKEIDVMALTEDEMKEMPTSKLIDILVHVFGINPSDHPGKNTNAKLRSLILSAREGEEKEEEKQTEAVKPVEEPEEATESDLDPEVPVTIDMLRTKARELIEQKKREVVADAFKSCGCSNFGGLKESDYNKFYDLLCLA